MTLLVRNDEIIRFAVVRLVREQTFARFQPRAILTEDTDIRGHSEVWATVIDNIAAVVAHSLDLNRQTPIHTLDRDAIDNYR